MGGNTFIVRCLLLLTASGFILGFFVWFDIAVPRPIVNTKYDVPPSTDEVSPQPNHSSNNNNQVKVNVPKVKVDVPKPTETTKIDAQAARMSSKPNCSNNFFQRFFSKHYRFPDEVNWEKNFTSFTLSDCNVVPANMTQCLGRKKISYIAVYGDSQGMRFFHAVENFLANQGGGICKITASEDRDLRIPDLDYLARGDKALRKRMVSGLHNCTSCPGFRAECRMPDQKIVHVEFINTEGVQTDYVTLKATNDSAAVPSFEEFIFNVYFKKSFPDLNVFFLPMNHIKKKTVKTFTDMFPTFVSIIKKAKPPSSEVFFVPGPVEFEDAREKGCWYKNKLWFNLLASDAIRKLNSELTFLLEPEILNSTSKIFSFLNLADLAVRELITPDDGVHYIPQWYTAFWEVFMGVYCVTD